MRSRRVNAGKVGEPSEETIDGDGERRWNVRVTETLIKGREHGVLWTVDCGLWTVSMSLWIAYESKFDEGV